MEGTDEVRHITVMHHHYTALSAVLAPQTPARPVVLLVLTFGERERKQRATVLRRHIIAYANRAAPGYDLFYIDLEEFLALPAGGPPFEVAWMVDHGAERDKLKRYWGRQPLGKDRGDFEPH